MSRTPDIGDDRAKYGAQGERHPPAQVAAELTQGRLRPERVGGWCGERDHRDDRQEREAETATDAQLVVLESLEEERHRPQEHEDGHDEPSESEEEGKRLGDHGGQWCITGGEHSDDESDR
jgi:hypothetical protein